MNYSREQLEKLADLGILPSSLGIGEEGDTSAPYMEQGMEVEEDGTLFFYDANGADEVKVLPKDTLKSVRQN